MDLDAPCPPLRTELLPLLWADIPLKGEKVSYFDGDKNKAGAKDTGDKRFSPLCSFVKTFVFLCGKKDSY
jgi:hypothetical protein